MIFLVSEWSSVVSMNIAVHADVFDAKWDLNEDD